MPLCICRKKIPSCRGTSFLRLQFISLNSETKVFSDFHSRWWTHPNTACRSFLLTHPNIVWTARFEAIWGVGRSSQINLNHNSKNLISSWCCSIYKSSNVERFMTQYSSSAHELATMFYLIGRSIPVNNLIRNCNFMNTACDILLLNPSWEWP